MLSIMFTSLFWFIDAFENPILLRFVSKVLLTVKEYPYKFEVLGMADIITSVAFRV